VLKGKNEKKAKQPCENGQTTQEEMQKLFQNGMSERKQGCSVKMKDNSIAKKSRSL
jgi:hypothetical protein